MTTPTKVTRKELEVYVGYTYADIFKKMMVDMPPTLPYNEFVYGYIYDDKENRNYYDGEPKGYGNLPEDEPAEEVCTDEQGCCHVVSTELFDIDKVWIYAVCVINPHFLKGKELPPSITNTDFYEF